MDENTKKEVQEMIDAAVKSHRHDGVLTQRVLLTQLFGFQSRWQEILSLSNVVFSFMADTNGITPVQVFANFAGTATPAPFEVINIDVISLDTTAANITIKKNATAITAPSPIPKFTTAGLAISSLAMVTTGTPPANQFLPGDKLSIVSDSAGNARVRFDIYFPRPFA